MSSETYTLATVHCLLCERAGETGSFDVIFSSQFIRTGELVLGGRSSGTTISDRKICCTNCGVQFARFPEAVREQAESELAEILRKEDEERLKVIREAEERRREAWSKKLKPLRIDP